MNETASTPVISKQITDLYNWADNPRAIKKEKFEELKRRIKRLGQFKPLIVTDDGEVLGGNMRLRAYKELGITDVWVSVVHPKTEAEKIEIALTDNEEMGYYEDQALAELIAKYKDDIDLTKYSVHLKQPQTLQEILDQLSPEEVVEDEAPEAPEVAESKLGEVYQLGRHRLICGDSTKIEDVEKLMNGQKADMVFTDPPYGMDLDTDYTGLNWGDRKGKKYDAVIGDKDDFVPELITKIFDNFNYCKEMFLWGADYYFELIPEFKKGHYIVWDKTLESNGDADSNSEYELLWTKQKHKRIVMHFNWFRYFGLGKQDQKKRIHPTQKPLQVLTPIIEKYSKDNEIIVDLFGGSGSTLIACEQTDRTCYMMELDPKYCDVIRKRYENFTNRKITDEQ